MTIGVDLGGTNIRAGIQVKGTITEKREAKLLHKESLQRTLEQLINIIEPMVCEGVQGIGVAVPSVVDPVTGVVYNVVNIPSWVRVELKDLLENHFNLPVEVDNDANCFVAGEKLFGIAKPYSSVVGMVLGTGLGTGLYINGAVHVGHNCGAGELGYWPYREKHLEAYCSNDFFTAHQTSALEAHKAALQGDRDATALYDEFGKHLSAAVKAAVYAYDPEVIVFGGSIAKAYDFFKDSLSRGLSDFLYPVTIDRLKIIPSTDENTTLLGAGSLIKVPQHV